MKAKMLLLTIFIVNLIQAQTVLIPNGGFNTDTSGWSIDGGNSISNTGTDQSNVMYINATGVFTVTSPQFNLNARGYKLHTDYYRTFLDPFNGKYTVEANISVLLKNLSGVTVANLNINDCSSTDYINNTGATCSSSSSSFNITTSGTYYLEFSSDSQNSFEFFLDNVGFEEIIQNTFSGKVTLDVNNDGCSTSTVTVENYPIQVNETSSNTSYNVFTDDNGEFVVETSNLTGNFVTQADYVIYNASPLNYTNVVSTGVNNFTNQDFCISPNTVTNDLIVTIIPTIQARPGFNTSYQIKYTNFGTTTLSGIVDLSYDSTSVTYINASTTPNTTTANSLSWNYVNLAPFETRTIDVNFNVFTPPTVNNGDVLAYSTSISPLVDDNTPTNNTYTFSQITIGSYDPNDITILEGPFISESQADDYLAVVIRFQNTGTASAINITVENTLDPFLDWSTFQAIAASHSYNTVISNGNEVNFVFNGINLADSTTDEPNSHGWIFYRIKPKNTFAIGDIISNKADIYFDYNLPIITNTATTQIDASLSINIEANNQTLTSIFPNPVEDQFIISTKSVAFYNLLSINGLLIKKGKLKIGKNIINISNLSTGLYLIKTTTTNGKTFANKVYKK